ncbi:unnamed protein product [Diamesa tonsa]
MKIIMLLLQFQKTRCSSIPTFPVKVEKFIHTCQSEIRTNLVDDLIYAAVHENPFKDHKDGSYDDHKDKDSNEQIYKFLDSFGNGHNNHHSSDHHASDHHSHTNHAENHHHSPELYYPSEDSHSPHPQDHYPSNPTAHSHHSSNSHHTPDLSQHSSHDHQPPAPLNYVSFPPYPPSHETVHPSIEPHQPSHPISHESIHPSHTSHAPHDSRLPANVHSPADAHQTLAYYIGLAEKLQNANQNLNNKSKLKWHRRSTRGILFGKSIQHDDTHDDNYHSKLITHEDQWLAGCLMQCIFRKNNAVDKKGFPTLDGVVELFTDGIHEHAFFMHTLRAVDRCLKGASIKHHIYRGNDPVKGQTCDVAFDIFDCVSDSITEYCNSH